ncbi:unnamed protein product [Vitrella brassicaformis CCMP3155]|uniref:Uncharacterized protein n=4 Tax=Vitrella brassicaformis TaxID=1169539 RepID=A0A0G4GS41_VITBC|nr:unnamed protein product [Vitrella brassicaformis CCMP3155]|eukprot:CEM33418.1 unnamed protein product [Vitrella brassicaformis CCMP3155]
MGGSHSALRADVSPLAFLRTLEKLDEDEKMGDEAKLAATRELFEKAKKRRGLADKKGQVTTRDERDHSYDQQLVEGGTLAGKPCKGIMRFIRAMSDRPGRGWRRLGLEVASSFFSVAAAREEMVKMDIAYRIVVFSLPESDAQTRTADFVQHQVFAARLLNDMADFPEFFPSLLSSTTMNALCLLLTQLAEVEALVLHCFARLSEWLDNLEPIVDQGALEYLSQFFRTSRPSMCVAAKRKLGSSSRGDRESESSATVGERHLRAIQYCASVLATFVRFGSSVSVEYSVILEALQHTSDIKVLAEISRLLYWLLRRHSPNEVLSRLEAAAQPSSLQTVVATLCSAWTHKALPLIQPHQTDSDKAGAGGGARLVTSPCTSPCQKASGDEEEHRRWADRFVCHMNLSLWLLLPLSQFRWRAARAEGIKGLSAAFAMPDSLLGQATLGCVRQMMDTAEVRQTENAKMLRFFCCQVLWLLHRTHVHDGHTSEDRLAMLSLLLDTLAACSTTRDNQQLLRDADVWQLLSNWGILSLEQSFPHEDDAVVRQALELSCLRCLTSVATHPLHRLAPLTPYPPRTDDIASSSGGGGYTGQRNFLSYLTSLVGSQSAHVSNLATFTLMAVSEDSFLGEREAFMTLFASILQAWERNSSFNYDERAATGSHPAAAVAAAAAAEKAEGQISSRIDPRFRSLFIRGELVRLRMDFLTTTAALTCTSPYIATTCLSWLSRVALEPAYKQVVLDSCLSKVLLVLARGVMAEVREAAALVANLLWGHHSLVCWLKMDTEHGVAVDSACVLVPRKVGSPVHVPIGLGMFGDTWGFDFIKNSWIELQPSGVQPSAPPGLLIAAPTSETFDSLPHTFSPLREEQPTNALGLPGVGTGRVEKSRPSDAMTWTMTCWVRMPLSRDTDHCLVESIRGNRVLAISREGAWSVTTRDGEVVSVDVPQLQEGWHLVSVVSSADGGTRIGVDGWQYSLTSVWIDNAFYAVGNTRKGDEPFGVICDFRIYSTALSPADMSVMLEGHVRDHPDGIVKRLHEADAAVALSRGLAVPDSRAEALRALANLATHSPRRAQVFSVCWPLLLEYVNCSQSPMVQRQATRLLQILQ